MKRRDLLTSTTSIGALFSLGFPLAPSVYAQTVGKTPVRGGVLNVAISPEPTQLTSANLTTMNVGMVSSKVLEGLVSYDLDLKPVPALAESWRTTPDGGSTLPSADRLSVTSSRPLMKRL